MDKETQDKILHHRQHVMTQIELIARVTGKHSALQELEKSFRALMRTYDRLVDHEISERS